MLGTVIRMTHIFYFKLNGGFFTFFQEHSCPQVKKCRSTIGFCLEHLSACRNCTHQQHQFTKAKLRLINREMTFRLHKTAPISASTVPGVIGLGAIYIEIGTARMHNGLDVFHNSIAFQVRVPRYKQRGACHCRWGFLTKCTDLAS